MKVHEFFVVFLQLKKTRFYKLFLLSLKKEIGKNKSFMLFEFYELLVYQRKSVLS